VPSLRFNRRREPEAATVSIHAKAGEGCGLAGVMHDSRLVAVELRQAENPDAADESAMEVSMEEQGVGWIAAIIIGGLAGFLAEKFMKSDMGILMNVLLGIVGAALASAILGLVGISLGGWLGYLIAGFIGASVLIAVVRAFRSRTA